MKQCCLPLQELLVVTDGWAAYPKSIRRVCARKSSEPRSTRTVSAGDAWPGLLIGTGIKRTECKHVVEVVRRMAASVWRNEPSSFWPRRKRGTVLHTSCIERINGTFRERLASLTRRCRHASHCVEMLEARDVACWLYLQLLLAPSRARADNGNRT